MSKSACVLARNTSDRAAVALRLSARAQLRNTLKDDDWSTQRANFDEVGYDAQSEAVRNFRKGEKWRIKGQDDALDSNNPLSCRIHRP